MVGAFSDVVIVVPPCFAPKLSNRELDVLNNAVYNLGASIMVHPDAKCLSFTTLWRE